MTNQTKVPAILNHKAEVVAAAARDAGDEAVRRAAERVRSGYLINRAAAEDVALVQDFFRAIRGE